LSRKATAAGLFTASSAPPDVTSNFLAAIIASSDDAIISKDLNGIVSSWNEGARRIFGYEPEEMVGQPILRLIPADLHHEEDFILRKIRAGERVEHFETTRVRKSGERFPISVTISPICNDRGKVIGASKIARDISDRRRVDESRSRLAAIVDSADDAIISKNLSGIITSWNNGARRLFGYEEDEIVGRSILTLIPPHLRHEEDDILRRLRAGEKIEHYETTRMTKDGEFRDVSITISPIRNGFGDVIGASKIARDVSDRKKVERLAIEAEKIATTGRMAAAIAHEINNPLGSVLNLIYLARQEGVSPQELREYLATAESELERVSHIARQTLGYYRDTGSPSDVRLSNLMENVLAVYRRKLLSLGIVVASTYNDRSTIRARSGEMVQVFSNVVCNAIDAMPLGGKLSISITQSGAQSGKDEGELQIDVADTGSGIRQENLERVFEPFFTTKGNLGTGIGLWVAKQLVERHCGRISISSHAGRSNSGTIVTVCLPFSHSDDQPAQPSESRSRVEIQ
jgi:PAS domain S-box-containing protein